MSGQYAGRGIRWVVSGLLALASLACSLSASGDETAQTARIVRESPLVLLLVPVNGSTYAEGVQVTLHAVAQDTEIGVARVEFRVDEVPVGSVAASTPGGDPWLDAAVDWVAASQTGHLITVEAFRADGSSLGSRDATVKVVASPMTQLPSGQPQGSITPSPTGTAADNPVVAQTPSGVTPTQAAPPSTTPPPTNPPRPGSASANGQATAQVNTPNLNVRQGPGTQYPSVGTLTQGETITLVGRNADSSWWAIAYGGGTAWVFAGLTTAQGNLGQLPLVAPPEAPASSPVPLLSPTSPPPADLVIDSLRLDPATPAANVTFTVYASVRNKGGTASPETDALAIFQPGDERSPADPRIPPLQPGQSAEIFFRVTLKAAGTGLVGTVDVDVYNAVSEGDTGETNNRKTITYDVTP